VTAPAFGYVRLSKEDADKPSQSPAVQREAIVAYCRRNDLELREVFVDVGVSGAVPIGKRPGGLELCRRLAHRTARGAHVVVAKVDRAWRKASDALSCVDDWQRAGIGVHLLNLPEPHVTSPAGRMMLGMLAIFAEWERGQISERTTAAIRHRKKAGRRFNRAVPLGYELVAGGALIPCREDCLTAHLIDVWSNQARLSGDKVATRLLELDRPVPPGGVRGDKGRLAWLPPEERRPSKLGQRWHQKTVWSVAKRMTDDEQYRTEVLREVGAARAAGWTEPDPLGPAVRERLA
jgi:DNA invertase Pin-like site-specific DNA recombinase